MDFDEEDVVIDQAEEYDEEADPFDDLFENENRFDKMAQEEEDEPRMTGMEHRGTFVGTPLYASPEMLNSSASGPFTDLWALGVIIYQLVAGEVPWKGNKDFVIFQQILECQIKFPNNMPDDAVDIIYKLLQLNPLERLGCGNTTYKDLKAHKFFKGINFERIA